MTSTVAVDYSEYVGKKVVVTRNTKDDDGQPTAVEIEGTCEAANDSGIILKPKGKTQFELIETDEVEQVVLAAETAKKIKAKKIRPVTIGQVRSHLLERHGITLSEANDMTEEEAYAAHESIDHVAADLGHIHVEPKADDKADSTEE